MKIALLLIIRIYQKYISLLLPGGCRFHPTCSEYIAQAIKKYGILRGLGLGIWRVLRCNPWNPGGYDPVP